MSDNRRKHDDTLPIRLRQLFGRVGLVPRLMSALDRGHTSVEDICAGRNVPPEVAWIVECLELAPLWAWPKRWRDCRGVDADPHNPKRGRLLAEMMWSDDELLPVKTALLAGATRAEAGALVGLSEKATSQLVYRNRLPKTPSRRCRTLTLLSAEEWIERNRKYQRDYQRKRREQAKIKK